MLHIKTEPHSPHHMLSPTPSLTDDPYSHTSTDDRPNTATDLGTASTHWPSADALHSVPAVFIRDHPVTDHDASDDDDESVSATPRRARPLAKPIKTRFWRAAKAKPASIATPVRRYSTFTPRTLPNAPLVRDYPCPIVTYRLDRAYTFSPVRVTFPVRRQYIPLRAPNPPLTIPNPADGTVKALHLSHPRSRDVGVALTLSRGEMQRFRSGRFEKVSKEDMAIANLQNDGESPWMGMTVAEGAWRKLGVVEAVNEDKAVGMPYAYTPEGFGEFAFRS